MTNPSITFRTATLELEANSAMMPPVVPEANLVVIASRCSELSKIVSQQVRRRLVVDDVDWFIAAEVAESVDGTVE